MGIQIERTCDRCRRADPVAVSSAAEAVAVEDLEAKRDAKTVEIEAYLNSIPSELMPDVVVFVKGAGTVLTHICDIGDAKRSCARRVVELAGQMEKLAERKKPEPKPADAAAA